jgi:hypothetical protein
MRVLVLDVPRILDEDTLIRPKPLKANFGENVNTQIVESKRGSSKPIDAFHNMKEEEGSRERLSRRLARYLAKEHL